MEERRFWREVKMPERAEERDMMSDVFFVFFFACSVVDSRCVLEKWRLCWTVLFVLRRRENVIGRWCCAGYQTCVCKEDKVILWVATLL